MAEDRWPKRVSLVNLPSTATIPVTGLVSISSAATIAITGSLSISSAATIPITGSISLGSAATIAVVGSLTHNTVTDQNGNVGVLTALVATSSPPVTTGNMVFLSVNSANNLRVIAATVEIYDVQHKASATIPVSLLTLPSTATIPVTGSLSVGSAATLPVTVTNTVSISSAATIPITGSIAFSSAATLPVEGSLANNAGTDSTDNLGALVAIAVTTSPSYVASNRVYLNVATSGYLRVIAATVEIYDVQHKASATIPVSLLTLPSTATIPVTGSLSVGSAATLPVTITNAGLPSAATLPITGVVGLGVSATIPVSVSSAATLPVSVSSAATLFTAFSTAATMFVSFTSAATIPVSARGRFTEDAAWNHNEPFVAGGVAVSSGDASATMTMSANGDVSTLISDRNGALYVIPYGPHTWRTGSEITITAGSTDVALKAATATGLSLYLGSIFMSLLTVPSATVRPAIHSGTGQATLIFKPYLPTLGSQHTFDMVFQPPWKLTASTPINFSSTATETGTIFISLTGYTAP